MKKQNFFVGIFIYFLRFIVYRDKKSLETKNMGKYTQEIKDKCVEMVKMGVSLKDIQTQIGPNPKAVERYLKKAGVEKPKVLRVPKVKTEKETSKKVSKNQKGKQAQPVESDY